MRLDVVPHGERQPDWTAAGTIGTKAWTRSENHGFDILGSTVDSRSSEASDINQQAARFGFDIHSGEVAIDDFEVTKACRFGVCAVQTIHGGFLGGGDGI